MPKFDASLRGAGILLAAFLILSTGIGLGGYRYYLAQKSSLEAEVRSQLQGITEMKVRRIADWRRDRLEIAQVIAASAPLMPELSRTLAGTADGTTKARLSRWLESLYERLDAAGAALVDAEGKMRLSGGRLYGPQAHLRERARDAIEAGKVQFTDLHRESNGSGPHMGINIPLLSPLSGKPEGALLLGIDPEAFLYPLIQRWPTQTRSAETLLVRREGNEVLYLNELRHSKNTALNLRLPLTSAHLPAARVVLGLEGVADGVDYRNVPVLAAVKAIPDSPWYLVAKIDAEEVYAPLRSRGYSTLLAVLALILATGATLALIWRDQISRFYRQKYEAEVERRALAGHYDYLSRYANDIIVLTDGAGTIIEANDRATSAYGCTREELVGSQLRDLSDPQALDQFEADGREVKRHESLVFETRHRHKSGRVFPVEVSVRRIVVDGEIFRQSIIRDISERKAIEEQLRQTTETLKTAVEASPVAILTVSPEGIVTFWNRAAEQIFGWQAGEVVGHPLPIVPEGQREEARLLRQRILNGETFTGLELERVRKDGVRITVSLHAAALHDPNGQVTGYMAVLMDISERKRAELAQSKLQGQLQQAQKMETVGRLAGGVAHDFNNLLTVINGYAELISSELDPDDPLRAALAEITRAGDRAAALTQQLLAFSRKQVIEPKLLSPNELVTDIGRMLRRLMGDDIEVVTILHPETGQILADAGQINQVLMNLAVNARDAMPAGGRLLIETSNADIEERYAEAHMEVQPGSYVGLGVSDTGAGMDAETRSHIFEPFFTTKPLGQGTGLGLSTVYGIVKQNGGWIWVYSEPGRGTTFKIYLPRVDRASAAPDESRSADFTLHGTETVLVVEDQQEVRRLALGALRSYGYQVLDAANGDEALDLCEQFPGPIHLLVTDMVMPGITGREVAGRLSALRPAMKTLYVSGYAASLIGDEGILNPNAAYLSKPFSPEALARKVREVLGTPQVLGD